jgi:ABC-type multidrug transport system fused ATPase/permease subunit
MTQIGEKGVNLSGGQKARCALARALYNKSDILLLDDVLSAVDAIVGKTIFDKAIGPNSLSKHTTRILVTHSQIPLEHSDLIVIMQGGEIFRSGKYVDLIENGEVSRLICKLENTSESLNSNERERTKSIQSYKKSSKLEKKLIAEEKVQTGSVGSAIYLYYLKKMGRLVFSGFISFLALNYVLSVIRSFWLSTWSDNVSNDTMSVNSRLGVFVGIGLFEVLLQYISNVFLIYVIVNTGLRLHQPLLHNIIRSKMSFFDVTPLGRLINRFSKDIEVVDSRLIGSFRFFFICIFSVFSTLIIISISTPLFILVVIPLFIAYVLLIVSEILVFK